MKFLSVIAAIALIGMLGRGSKADSGSDALSGSLSFDEFMKNFNQSDIATFDELFANGGQETDSSTTDLTSDSGSMEFESFSDFQDFISNLVEEWSPSVSEVVAGWVESNSVEFKEFQRKMDEINALVDEIKNLPGFESMASLSSLLQKVTEKMEEVNAFVRDTEQKNLAKYVDTGSLTLEETLEMFANATMYLASASGSYSMPSEGSNEEQTAETSAKARSSPSFQKTWDKLTGNAPVTQSSI